MNEQRCNTWVCTVYQSRGYPLPSGVLKGAPQLHNVLLPRWEKKGGKILITHGENELQERILEHISIHFQHTAALPCALVGCSHILQAGM